jgi:hypothetical protein
MRSEVTAEEKESVAVLELRKLGIPSVPAAERDNGRDDPKIYEQVGNAEASILGDGYRIDFIK